MTFRVYGTPIPQGSLRVWMTRGAVARPILSHDNRKVMPWRQEIAGQAQNAGVKPLEGPVRLTIRFYLPRPKSLPKKVRHPDRRPDLDKLARSVLDALTHIAFANDSQVVELRADKRYGSWVGAEITVRPVEDVVAKPDVADQG